MNVVMNRMVLVCALLMVAASAMAADPAKPKEEKKAKLPSILSAWADQAGLDDAQRDQLITANAVRTTTQKDIGAKHKVAKEKAAAAKAAGDKAAEAAATEEIKALREAIIKSDAEFEGVVRSTLRPEQLVKWETARLSHGIQTRYKKVGLSEDQQKAVDAKAAEAAPKVVAAAADAKLIAEIKKALYTDIDANVLTEAQRTELSKKPEKKEEAKEEKEEKKE